MAFNRFHRPRLLGLAAGVAACTLAACDTVEKARPDVFATSPHPSANFPNIAYATWSTAEPPYRLYPGDEVEVTVPSAPELSKTVTVQPDGRISLALLPPVEVADRTLGDVENILDRAYASQLLQPMVTVSVKAAPLKVFVGGEVDKPGVYDMPGDINALQAVIMAGGFKTAAKRTEVVIIRRGPNGQAMMRTANLMRGVSDPGLTDVVPLRRFDVVYVPRTRIAEAGIFVQQYFRDINPVQFGFNYTVGPTYLAGTVAK
ncbi:polysaccharide biosynthesis/export family protein [Phenylobacterium montanum]|uniref:Polysaccharide export protein n=1 Tax=Phenylobacterium montanum TaxID=2823693 RepID=A0A975G0Z4_9CAUL|nr:polysaccharide biosynthesis/export family protein [Caulobacter sp. S6]QUD88552.1 polysaccharide export protein [Caulobacter sp. S6]